MKKILFSFLVLTLCFCNIKDKKTNTNSIKNTSLNKKHINNNILKELDLYQKEYPIPKINTTANNFYHYNLIIKDSILTIMRIGFIAPKEVDLEIKGMFYYNDSIPVSIQDKKEIESSVFYDKKDFNNELSSKFKLFDYSNGFDETFPPKWVYKIKNEKLILIEKDTIWKSWK